MLNHDHCPEWVRLALDDFREQRWADFANALHARSVPHASLRFMQIHAHLRLGEAHAAEAVCKDALAECGNRSLRAALRFSVGELSPPELLDLAEDESMRRWHFHLIGSRLASEGQSLEAQQWLRLSEHPGADIYDQAWLQGDNALASELIDPTPRTWALLGLAEYAACQGHSRRARSLLAAATDVASLTSGAGNQSWIRTLEALCRLEADENPGLAAVYASGLMQVAENGSSEFLEAESMLESLEAAGDEGQVA